MKLPEFKRDKRNALEKEMDRLIFEMSLEENQMSDSYKKKAEALDRLINLYNKRYHCDGTRQDVRIEKLSPNTVLVVIGGIIEILTIMTYEQTHVFATKAFGRILRGRI